MHRPDDFIDFTLNRDEPLIRNTAKCRH